MFDPKALLTFILAAYILIVVPGPAVLYVVARSIEQGKAGCDGLTGSIQGPMRPQSLDAFHGLFVLGRR